MMCLTGTAFADVSTTAIQFNGVVCKSTNNTIGLASAQAVDAALKVWKLPEISTAKGSVGKLVFQKDVAHLWNVTSLLEATAKHTPGAVIVSFLITPWKLKSRNIPYRMEWTVRGQTRACDIYSGLSHDSVGVLVYDQERSQLVLNVWFRVHNFDALILLKSSDSAGDYGRLIISINLLSGRAMYEWKRCDDLVSVLKKGEGVGKGYIHLD